MDREDEKEENEDENCLVFRISPKEISPRDKKRLPFSTILPERLSKDIIHGEISKTAKKILYVSEDMIRRKKSSISLDLRMSSKFFEKQE